MTEVAVAEKPKVILVGGMDYNIPDELKNQFEIVKHLTQGARYQTLPQADYVFVITQWANHNVVENVKKQSGAPVVWLQSGWASMKMELQRRSILLADASPAPATVAPATTMVSASTLGLSEGEIWKKFGEKMIEACRGVLKIGEKVSEKDLLEVLSMAGPPPEDCRLFLPRMQMFGVVSPLPGGFWRLASTETEPYEDRDASEAPPPTPPHREKPKRQVIVEAPDDRLRRIPGTPSLVVRLIAGLKQGPYPTKRSIYKEMRKFEEFAGLTDGQIRSFVERAIEAKVIDDTHESLFVDHKADVVLTAVPVKPQEVAQDKEPTQEEISRAVATASIMAPFVKPAPSQGLNQEDAQRKWCFVVDRVGQLRQRVSDILKHCRIEWMGSNNVLVIFIPPALSQCQKFLEAMENWGAISRTTQEHFTKDTVIRFMLDNGLRG